MSLKSIVSNENCFILAGDIGGTNTSVALMELREGKFLLRQKKVFPSQEISGLEYAIDCSLPDFRSELKGQNLAGACFTAAGPVQDNTCQLTNVEWSIDANALTKSLGIPSFVINDLSGICFGIPLLDPSDPQQLLPLPHPDGSFPEPQELRPGTEVRSVVAPGTGLGIGYLIHDRGNYLALPAEAGHIDWGAYNDETRDMQQFMQHKYGQNVGVEHYISGRGLEHLLEYFIEARQAPMNATLTEIMATSYGNRGQLISKHAKDEATCRQVMEMFVDNLARFMSSVALWSLPKAGLYIAGGIPAKNRSWFLDEHRFMKTFLKNYLEHMEGQLAQVPVYMALDYGINLFGAAHGFYCLRNLR